jgi:hypothetical protein
MMTDWPAAFGNEFLWPVKMAMWREDQRCVAAREMTRYEAGLQPDWGALAALGFADGRPDNDYDPLI